MTGKPEANPDVIALFEWLLEEARAGRIRNTFIVYDDGEGQDYVEAYETDDLGRLVFEVKDLAMKVRLRQD